MSETDPPIVDSESQPAFEPLQQKEPLAEPLPEPREDESHVQAEIQNFRREIAYQTKTENTDHEASAKPEEKQTKTASIQKILDRVKYPSNEDLSKIIQTVIVPTALINLGAFISYPVEFAAAANHLLSQAQLQNLFNISIGTQLLITGAAAGPMMYLALQEYFGEKSFGKYLTIRKTAVTEKIADSYPALKSDQHYGEMHFVGRLHTKFDDSPIAIARAGMQELATLAGALEAQDPQLEGIDHFVGVSSLLDDRFKRYGFDIYPAEESTEPQSFLESIFYKVSDAIYSRLYNMPTQTKPLSVGIIDRATLIEHKDQFARLGHNPEK